MDEIDLIREHNQYILTNELWNCQARAKFGSMLWGMVVACFVSLTLIRKRSVPEKALSLVCITYMSMLYSKIAFTERVIDVYYPIFKFDMERFCNDVGLQEREEILKLGKSSPVNKKMSQVEKDITMKRLGELKANTDIIMSRFDDIDELNPPKKPWKD